MSNMKVVKVSELRQNLQDVVDSVFYTGKSVIVMRRNKPRVIINPLPAEDKKLDKIIKEYLETSHEFKNTKES